VDSLFDIYQMVGFEDGTHGSDVMMLVFLVTAMASKFRMSCRRLRCVDSGLRKGEER